jgi:hypothetical protein
MAPKFRAEYDLDPCLRTRARRRSLGKEIAGVAKRGEEAQRGVGAGHSGTREWIRFAGDSVCPHADPPSVRLLAERDSPISCARLANEGLPNDAYQNSDRLARLAMPFH